MILMNFANSDASYSMHPLAKFCKHYAREWRSQKSFTTQMAITGRPFLVLEHTLQTTLSRLSLAASCKIGIQCEYHCMYKNLQDNKWCRCTASNEDLDGRRGRRTHELTEVLMEAHDEKALWFGYGIVPGIMVSSPSMLLHGNSIMTHHIAFHTWVSQSQYSQDHNAGYSPPGDQRDIQRPLSDVG